MTTIDYGVICEQVIVDQSNKVSHINLFDVINVQRLPATHPNVMFSFRAAPDKKLLEAPSIHVKAEVVDPLGKKVLQAEADAPLDKDRTTPIRQIGSAIDLSGAVFRVEGIYKIVLYIGGKKIYSRNLEIKTEEKGVTA